MEFVSHYQGGFLLPRVIKCVTENPGRGYQMCRRVIKCVTENFVTEDKAKEVEG